MEDLEKELADALAELPPTEEPTTDEPIEPVAPEPATYNEKDITEMEDKEAEDMASRLGWQPERRWSPKNGQTFLSAKDFLMKGRLIGLPKNDILNQVLSKNAEMQSIRSELEAQKAFNARMTKMLTEQWAEKQSQKISQLRSERNKALMDEGDQAKADEIDAKILEEAAKRPEAEAPTPIPRRSPDYQAFLDRNPWVDSDAAPSIYATEIAPVIRTKFAHLSEAEKFKQLENAVAAKFPDLAEQYPHMKRGHVRTPTPVGGRTPAPAKGKKEVVLSQEEEKLVQYFIDQKVFKNKEEYLASLK